MMIEGSHRPMASLGTERNATRNAQSWAIVDDSNPVRIAGQAGDTAMDGHWQRHGGSDQHAAE